MSSDSEKLVVRFPLRIDRLRSTREMRGLSQRELAKVCDLSPNQIHRYETEASQPDASILAVIAHALGVSTDYLLGLSDVPTPNAPANLRADERDLLEAYTLGDSIRMISLMNDRLQKLVKAGEGEKS